MSVSLSSMCPIQFPVRDAIGCINVIAGWAYELPSALAEQQQ